MRKLKKGTITLSYPDEVGFAFNPCLLIAEGFRLDRMDVDMSCGDMSYSVLLEAMGGRCYVDVKEYVQTFFNTMSFGAVDYGKEGKTDMGKKVSFTVVVTTDDDTESVPIFTFEVFYIWGALNIGGKEIYNGYREVTWFRGFPFTVGVYASGASPVKIYKDGNEYRTINISEQGVWNIPLKSDDDAIRYLLFRDDSGGIKEISYGMSSGYSDSGGRPEKILVNIVEDYDEGYYLRWLNRHGFYCYYLFKQGSEVRKVSYESVFTRNNITSYDMGYGFQGYTGKLQNATREDTVPVCAPLVDGETWDMLFDIATSPSVDLFTGYRGDEPTWMPVTVVAGSYTKEKAVLQDFVCSIVMPDVPIQKL